MKLSGYQLEELTNIVGPAFPQNEFKALLEKAGKDFNSYAPTNIPYNTQIEEVLRRANSEGWVLLLIKEISSKLNDKPILKPFFEKYPDIEAANTARHYNDPYDSEWLDNGQVFLSRKTLRRHLRRCGTNQNPCGIIITADPSTKGQSGKTYSKEFISFIANQQRSNHRVAYVDLDKYDYSFLDLAKTISDELGLDRDKLPSQDGDPPVRWATRLVGWILNQCYERHIEACWIVLDGFKLRPVHQDTYAFIDNLADAIANKRHGRLVLINFDKNAIECKSKQYEHLFFDFASPPSESDIYDFFKKLLPPADSEDENKYKIKIQQIVSTLLHQTSEQSKKDINQKLSYFDWLNLGITRAARALTSVEAE